MRGRALRALGVAIPPTLALVVLVGLFPDRAELVVHLWLLAIVAITLTTAVLALRAAYPDVPSSFDATGRGAEGTSTPLEGLDRAEREVALSMSSAFDAHLRLRPALQEIAGELLAVRRGIDLERSPERARQLLGEETWSLVRPDRAAPEQRHGGGIDAPELDRVLRTLERL